MDDTLQFDPSTREPGSVTLVRDDELDQKRADQQVEQDRRTKSREFAHRVLERWQIMAEGDRVQRKRASEAQIFNSGHHWDDEMRKEREDKERVCIEVNRTPQYLNQVANARRMARPSILISPNGNGADENTALIKQGIIRSIERRGDAESIRDDAFYGMLEKGYSYRRVNVCFEAENSWRRVIRPGRFFSDFSVYHDPGAVEPDLTDAQDWVITDDMPLEEYVLQYGDFANMEQVRKSLDALFSPQSKSANDTITSEDWARDWIGENVVRVCEYFYKERTKEKLYALADNPESEGRWESELPKDENDAPQLIGILRLPNDDGTPGEPVWRWEWRTRIMWAKVDADRVLEGNADLTAGREYIKPRNGISLKYIPIIPTLGQRRVVDKHVIYDGMVQDGIAPCLASDYWLSALTEMVALGPKAPWVVVYDAIAEYREMWDSANIENYAALYYDHKDAEGNELPAPFRQFGETPIQAMTFILNYAEEDLKRVMGIYNRSLGQTGPEHSGVAIQNVQREADVANFHYPDNDKRSMELEAKIYLNLIPIVYSEPQVVEIIRTDNNPERATINQLYHDADGNEQRHDMAPGDYDVEVEIGWSAATKRELSAQQILDYLKVDQEAAPLVGYLLARYMDFPAKDELEAVLKARAIKMGANIPEDNGAEPKPEQLKAQNQALSQQLQQLQQQLQQIQQAIATDQIKHRNEMETKAMELASQERQTRAKIESDIAKAEIGAKSKADIEMIKHQLEQVAQDLQLFRDGGGATHQYDPATDQIQPVTPQPPADGGANASAG